MPFVPDKPVTATTPAMSSFKPDAVQPEPAKEKGPGIFSRIATQKADRVSRMHEIFSLRKSTEKESLPKQFARSAAVGLGIAGQGAAFAGDVVGTAAIEAGKAVLDQDSEQAISDFVSRIAGSKPVQAGMKVAEDFSEKNPLAGAAIGGALNIAGTFGTGGAGAAAAAPATAAAKSALRSGIRAGTKAGGKAIDMATPIAKGTGKVAGDVVSSAGSHAFAMSPQTIKSIVSGRVSKEAMEKLDRVSLASRAKEGLDTAFDDLSGLGAEYEGIRTGGGTVEVPLGGRIQTAGGAPREFSKPVTDALKKYGLSIGEDGRIVKSINSKPFDPASVGVIQEFLDTYGQSGTLTADQFLNVRQAADKIVDWNAKDADLTDAFSRTLRENYDKLGKEQLDGLAALDAEYAPMRQELGLLKRDFLTSGGQLKDTALTSLANLTNKGREKVLARLEKYVPGITEDIRVLKAIEDIASAEGIKVGTYTRAGIVGGAFLANPLAGVLAFAATHPSVVVPALRAYGQVKRAVGPAIDDVIKKITGGKKLTKKDSKLVTAALSEETGPKASPPKSGAREFVKSKKEKFRVADDMNQEALTTKVLKDLEGKTSVSKQYIMDATNRGELKQVERDLIRDIVKDFPDKVDVAEFTKKVKGELLPLKVRGEGGPIFTHEGYKELERIAQRSGSKEDWKRAQDYMESYSTSQIGRGDSPVEGKSTRYESISLPDDLRGDVSNYYENIYESPVKTSAGDTHFGDQTENYFGHTRVEDMADGTRRVIEVQSDLYQKGGVEAELPDWNYLKEMEAKKIAGESYSHSDYAKLKGLEKEFSLNPGTSPDKLKQYNDPTAHFRMVREEIKKAAEDGVEKVQFPTGETAMKVEKLDTMDNDAREFFTNTDPRYLEVGQEIGLNYGEGELTVVRVNGSDTGARTGTFLAATDSVKFKGGIQDYLARMLEEKDYPELVKKFGVAEDGTYFESKLADDIWRATKNEEKTDSNVVVNRKLDEYFGKDRPYTFVGEDRSQTSNPGIDEETVIFELTEPPKSLNDLEKDFEKDSAIDTSNPIYKFYEKDMAKYLKGKYGAKLVTDDNGVSWYEVEIKPEYKGPVEAFRVKETLSQELGAEVTDDQVKEIMKLNKKIFGDDNVKIISQVISNSDALGAYEGGMISIVGGQADPKSTYMHEAVHKYLDVFTDEAEHVDILHEAAKEYGMDDFAKVEERLAEDFIKYAAARTGVTGKLKKIFDQVIKRIKKYLGASTKIDELYSKILYSDMDTEKLIDTTTMQ